MEGLLAKAIIHFKAHLDTASLVPITPIGLLYCRYFLLGMKIPSHNPSFLPSRRHKCWESAGSSFLPAVCYQSWHYFVLEGAVNPCAGEKGRRWPCRSSRMSWDLAMKLCVWFHVCKLELSSRSLLVGQGVGNVSFSLIFPSCLPLYPKAFLFWEAENSFRYYSII